MIWCLYGETQFKLTYDLIDVMGNYKDIIIEQVFIGYWKHDASYENAPSRGNGTLIWFKY